MFRGERRFRIGLLVPLLISVCNGSINPTRGLRVGWAQDYPHLAVAVNVDTGRHEYQGTGYLGPDKVDLTIWSYGRQLAYWQVEFGNKDNQYDRPHGQ